MTCATHGPIPLCSRLCLCAPDALRRASRGHVPTPRPPNKCRRRWRICVSAASDTVLRRGGGLCSTEQAPRSLNLCCHSLPLGGRSRPFRGQVANPMVRPIVSVGSGSGKGAWAGMCRGRGWNGAACTDLRTLLCAASVIPVGGHPKHLLGTWERVSGVACALADRAACPLRLRYTFHSPHTSPTLEPLEKGYMPATCA